MKKAKYSKNNQCFLCPRRCIILEGKRGFCNTRKNIGGNLYALNYGKPIGLAIDPIEKKPLYHFFPGKNILSFGTLGCNLDCLGCQNFDISKGSPDESEEDFFPPKKIIEIAKENNINMLAFTYTEPTIFFEYMIDVTKLAKKNNINTVAVSNGYIEKKPLKELIKHVDAFNIDLKFFDDKKYSKYSKAKLEPILETLKIINNSDSWLEITNLVIPNWNDDLEEVERMCEWIKDNLSKDVPIHFSAYYPTHKMNEPPTPLKTLKDIEKIARKHLDYVYLGNVKEDTNTICPACKKILIERDWYNTKLIDSFEETCTCGKKIPGIWK
ncbi:AmmeMemoRadiSam system radical SAM enzyme [Candidatus Woesearchaeota archaeon]|nr:MAG: AmmeMemoRadiSam system radical SAM enzyme [Candidatus Woesearchaeota archaeon]